MRLYFRLFVHTLLPTLCFIISIHIFSHCLNIHDEVIISRNIIKTNTTNYNQVIIPRNIIQTDIDDHSQWSMATSFKQLNPNHSYLFYDHAQAEEFVRKHMSPEIFHTYQMMPNTVLKIDYFRYISIYVLGGVYSDVDTQCLRPIDTWTDNYTNVGFIVGIEAEGLTRKLHTIRPLQLCQWAFAGRPNHPILKRMIDNIDKQAKKMLNSTLNIPLVMNWTGPGLWTDTVLDYFNEIYHVEWSTLKGLQHGRVIGDVYVLPIAGFQPSAYHFGTKGRKDPEPRVRHYFSATWRRQLVT